MATYYVATTGIDSNPGTEGAPWGTITHAAQNVNPGDMVRVKPGTYTMTTYMNTTTGVPSGSHAGGVQPHGGLSKPSRSGTKDAPIIYIADDPENKPRLRKAGNDAARAAAFFEIYDVSWITIDGFVMDDFYGTGMVVTAKNRPVEGVTIQNCVISNQHQDISEGQTTTPYFPWPGWYGVNFYCANEANPMKFCQFLNNTLSDLFTIGRWSNRDWPGFNEGMRIDGNCRHFLVEGNTMTRAFQIAFDVLGWSPGEARRLLGSSAPNPGQPKWIVYRGNTVRDTQRASTKLQANPMYVDRAAGPILFEDNFTDDTIGMYVSTEPYGYPGYEEPTLPHSDFIVRNNLMTHRGYGLMLGQCDNGGYGTYRPTNGNCPVHKWPVPDGTGKRWMYNFTVAHNTIINNSSSFPNLLYSYVRCVWTRNNVMVNNVGARLTQAVWPRPCGDASVCGPAEVNNWHSDGNFFFASNSPSFMWGGRNTYSNFDSYRNGSGQELHGLYGFPTFENPGNGDYRLASDSPGYNDAPPMTTAANDGSGSTELKVANARHFCDGWGVPGQGGDRIVINGEVYTIEAVDWEENLIQLDAAATWSVGEGVSYFYEAGRKSRGIGPSVSTKGSSPIPDGPDKPIPTDPELPNLPGFTVVQVTSQADLGYLDTSFIDSGVLLVGDMFPDQYDSRAWIRFNDVEIPQGHEIEEAYLVVWPWLGSGGPYDSAINGEDADDSAIYQGDRQDWDDRALTTASVSWQPSTNAVNKWIASPTIKEILSEITDRPGWQSGNSISLRIGDAEEGFQVQRRFQIADAQGEHGPRLLFKLKEPTINGLFGAYPSINLGSRIETRHGLSTVAG